ncbi:hypothetical protein KMW28_07970 [Flammeovirga yaeyamensis]|uniref:Uncharacterized protein n=1 Tax=Flammeovirga yaeyamensis TaxID=367791 RepID=A0AAX1N7N3_9BACT|nr:hypothetical protein [Flammeovirga yaeyamensis]MBB3699097.1 hypothetical protein [Flammeovirga yaeyamensis]NMF36531.1 hypothetical protein [Flammeovirga yaeyamensis]QWG03511.1 hypothetical protein KMW28_07970 [Flammeovirga yaeyamensis]
MKIKNIFSAIICLFILYQLYFDKEESLNYQEQLYLKQMNESFEGLITKKEIIPNRSFFRKIVFNDGEDIWIDYSGITSECYDSLHVGDFIRKEKTSPFIIVVRENQMFDILYSDTTYNYILDKSKL